MYFSMLTGKGISIHALFAEGDQSDRDYPGRVQGFLSTPSSQRATCQYQGGIFLFTISIHALFAEGDDLTKSQLLTVIDISIHALFAEGDT